MRTEDFNHMLRAARALLDGDTEGIDPKTAEWAKQLVSANPVEKRRPTPKRDQIFKMFEDDPALAASGATIAKMRERTNSKEVDKLAFRLSATGELWALSKMPGQILTLFFVSEDARNAAKNAWKISDAEPRKRKKKPKASAQMKIPQFVSKMIKPVNTAWNPDAGPARTRKKQATEEFKKTDAYTPPGVKVQVCPGYVAPHERLTGAFGAGFSSVGPGRDVTTGRAWE